MQEKNSEIRQLHKRLAEQERERHTETVKLRLEYDAKLLKLQKQSSRSQCVQSSSISSDIFRQVCIYAVSLHARNSSLEGGMKLKLVSFCSP